MFGPELKKEFMLQPDIHFINHGSYGSTPRQVMDAHRKYHERMEAEPVRFMAREQGKLIRESATLLAQFVGVASDDLVFVQNATTGINTVLWSLSFREGDEILINSQTYNAVRQAVTLVCRRTGAVAVVADIPFPMPDENAVSAAILSCVTSRTKLCILDHIVSPTAYVMPIEDIIPVLKAKGIMVLVDGAHAVGQLALDVGRLRCDFYTSNAHKWLCAPKGVAFLWVSKQYQSEIHPLVISHFLDESFTKEFDWTGTQDFSSWFAVKEALEFRHKYGDAAIREHNHNLALRAGKMLADAWGTETSAPDHRFGSMVLIRLPLSIPVSKTNGDRLHDILLDQYHIEVPIIPLVGVPQLWVRISAQIYNGWEDYTALRDAILKIKDSKL